MNGIMTVAFSYPSGEGDCCDYQVFTAHASKGQIGTGVYNFFRHHRHRTTDVRQKRQLQ